MSKPPSLEDIRALVGHRFPGGVYSIAHWENFLLTECTGAAPLPDGLAHPVALFHAPILGAKTTIKEMFTVGYAESDFSIGIESYDWEIFRPLREETPYQVTGEVSEADRCAAESHVFDRIQFRFELFAPGRGRWPPAPPSLGTTGAVLSRMGPNGRLPCLPMRSMHPQRRLALHPPPVRGGAEGGESEVPPWLMERGAAGAHAHHGRHSAGPESGALGPVGGGEVGLRPAHHQSRAARPELHGQHAAHLGRPGVLAPASSCASP